MKKRRIKLLASLTSLVLVVAVMAVGVWAAVNQTFLITSQVGFAAAKDVEAYIYGNSIANGTNGEITGVYFTNAHAKDSATEAQTTAGTEGDLYTTEAFEFDWSKSAITENTTEDNEGETTYGYTLTIVNNSTDNATNGVLTVSFAQLPTEPAENANYTLAITYGNLVLSGGTAVTQANAVSATTMYIANGASATITVTLTIVNEAKDLASTDIGFGTVTLGTATSIPA